MSSAEQVCAVLPHHLDAEFVLPGFETQSGYTGSPAIQFATQGRTGCWRQFDVAATAAVTVATSADTLRNRRAATGGSARRANGRRRTRLRNLWLFRDKEKQVNTLIISSDKLCQTSLSPSSAMCLLTIQIFNHLTNITTASLQCWQRSDFIS